MDRVDPPPTSASDAESPPSSPQTPRKLPDDLPTSLDDRRSFPSYGGETEMYDGWQGRDSPLCDMLQFP